MASRTNFHIVPKTIVSLSIVQLIWWRFLYIFLGTSDPLFCEHFSSFISFLFYIVYIVVTYTVYADAAAATKIILQFSFVSSGKSGIS